KALKTSLMFNESSNMKLSVNNQKVVKTFQILGTILMLAAVVLMAVCFMRVDSIVDLGEEALVSLCEEVEEEGRLYGCLPGTTIIEDTNRSDDSCSFELLDDAYDLAFQINSTAAELLYQAWMSLLDAAREIIHVASYYWSLTRKDVNVNDSSSKQVSLNHAIGEQLSPLQGCPPGHPVQPGFHRASLALPPKASPPAFCPERRIQDLSAVINIISEARKFVYVFMMEYFPTRHFIHSERYPTTDIALRTAAFYYRVQIRLLGSCRMRSDRAMLYYLRSLRALNNPHSYNSVDVKVLIVPVSNHTNVPHERVKYVKYIKEVYIDMQLLFHCMGTSYWSEDCSIKTACEGVIIKQNSTNPQRRQLPLQEQLRKLSGRDWKSKHAVTLEDVEGQKDCK
ncbi:LOW QUALITY PROTEIN: 5'-3' exonuclease PLD4, partial [Alca torda]